MSEQVKRPDWVPEGVPEGWKVEIRLRKNGKKDRYYTDPVHGYIFRSITDIDRYLLTGKLGRHVTKHKARHSSCAALNADVITHFDVPQKKELIKPDGMKESCLGLAAKGHYVDEKTIKRKAPIRADDSNEMMKKTVSESSNGKGSRSSKKRESTPPFYLIDPDKYEDTKDIDIPNLSEIIDSIRKEEDRKTVYVSAPAIGSLLKQTSETQPKAQPYNPNPRFAFNYCQHFGRNPSMPYVPSKFMAVEPNWQSKNIFSTYQHASPLPKFGTFGTDSRFRGEPGCAPFGNIITDPCFDFAVKTLSGTNPFARNTTVEDCFWQQQFGSSRMPPPQ